MEKVEKTLNINNKKKIKMTEELKSWFNSKVDEIIAKVKTSDVEQSIESVDVNITLADNEEMIDKLSEFEATVSELNNSITDLEGEKETLTEEVGRLSALVNKANAKGSEITTDGDPNVREEKVVDANEAGLNALLAKLTTYQSR